MNVGAVCLQVLALRLPQMYSAWSSRDRLQPLSTDKATNHKLPYQTITWSLSFCFTRRQVILHFFIMSFHTSFLYSCYTFHTLYTQVFSKSGRHFFQWGVNALLWSAFKQQFKNITLVLHSKGNACKHLHLHKIKPIIFLTVKIRGQISTASYSTQCIFLFLLVWMQIKDTS